VGSLDSQKSADVLVIRAQHEDPYESLMQTDTDSIVLLTYKGKPMLGVPEMEELFTAQETDYTTITVKGRKMLVQGDPAGLLKKIREAVGYKKILEFMPLDL